MCGFGVAQDAHGLPPATQLRDYSGSKTKQDSTHVTETATETRPALGSHKKRLEEIPAATESEVVGLNQTLVGPLLDWRQEQRRTSARLLRRPRPAVGWQAVRRRYRLDAQGANAASTCSLAGGARRSRVVEAPLRRGDGWEPPKARTPARAMPGSC